MRKLLIAAVANALLLLLTPCGGVYRVVAWKLGTFGGPLTWPATWFGVLVIYPGACPLSPTAPTFKACALSWWALIFWTLVQMIVKWRSHKPPLDPGISHCWLGKHEWIFAIILALVADAFLREYTGLFLMICFACSAAQLWIVRARRRAEAWSGEDTERLLAPCRPVLDHARA
ncbi:hypothetical protein ACYOEI_17625, partial [Singulisphaera rosea]